MTEQLKPCPFCGGAAHFEIDNDRWEWVECESCGMQGNRSASLMEDCKPKLTEAWNRRAQTAQAVPLLTEDEIAAALPHEPGDLDFVCARAIEQAVRAKLGVAVPMTDPQLQTSEERRATGERIMAQATQELSDLVRRARDIVVGHQKGSISLVQRRLQISYNTAAKLLEALEQEGVVSPQRQNGQREVLVLPDISGIVGKEGA